MVSYCSLPGIMLLSGADLERKEVDGSSPSERGMEDSGASEREETAKSAPDQMK